MLRQKKEKAGKGIRVDVGGPFRDGYAPHFSQPALLAHSHAIVAPVLSEGRDSKELCIVIRGGEKSEFLLSILLDNNGFSKLP
jgi:hypothetical protein